MATPGPAVLLIKDNAGNTQSLRVWQNSDGTFGQYTEIEYQGTAIVPAQDGTDATGSAPPAGATGIRGWLSAIYAFLLTLVNLVFSIKQPDVRQTLQPISPLTIGDSLVIALINGANTLGVQITGLSASNGAILAIEASKDGTNWYAKNALTSAGVVQSVSADGPMSIDVAGLASIRFRVSTAGTAGTILVSYSVSTATGIVVLGGAIPAGTNSIGSVTIGSASVSADGSIQTGGSSQQVFGSTVPTNGWKIQNPHPSEDLWVSDNGVTPTPNGASSVRVAANGGQYSTEPGEKPIGIVQIVGATAGHVFVARRW